MTFEAGLFWVFAAIMLFAAFRVITVKNPVHAALFLVLTFACSSVLWLLLEAEFLAIALVLVYVGAVMVLFLFVVMMLDINITALREGFVRYLPVGILIAAAMITVMVRVLGSGQFTAGVPAGKPADYSNTAALGQALYTDYLYPFEIAGAILLVAIIAAIVLTMRKRMETKYQNPAAQMKVKKSDRLRIIKMEAEKK
ncbi:MAG TPA: NADH-quinone oxidoreductase subunit J [Gammaproteobacteria bacterium]